MSDFFHVIGTPALRCPESTDLVVFNTNLGTFTMHLGPDSRLWKRAGSSCYGTLECLAGECAVAPSSQRSCTGGPNVFVTEPRVAPAIGGISLSIIGSCFSNGVDAFVDIGAYACVSPSVVSDSLITCTIPPGVGALHVVSVTVGGKTSFENCGAEEGCEVTYSPPAITSTSLSTCPAFGGCVLTVAGRNFGVPGQDGVGLKIIAGGQECVLSPDQASCPQCGHTGATSNPPSFAGPTSLSALTLFLGQSNAFPGNSFHQVSDQGLQY